LAECLGHVVLAALTVVAWLGLGSILLTPAPAVADRRLDALNRIGVGAIGFALATFAAGWAGALNRAAYAAVFAAAAVAGLVVAVRLVRHARLPHVREWRRWEQALGALLVVSVGLGLLATCAPISSPDALLYHAADPALFEKANGISEVTWNSSSYEPFTVEMLVLDGFLLWDSIQGAFAPLLLAIVALVAVLGAADRLAGRSVALLAGAIFFAQPFMTWEATSVFVEPGLAAAAALACWNLLHFVRRSETPALVLAGVFAGGAAGMKYLGLFVALALAVAGLLSTWRRLGLRQILAFGIPALLVALPWYVKNAVLTGNPFYPHLFGGLNRSAAAELARSMHAFGRGHSPLDFLLLPVRLLTDGEAFDGGEFITPLLLAFAPLALLLPQRRRPPPAVWVALLVFLCAWFATTQQARFLLPLMPVVAVLAALGVFALAARGSVGRTVAAGAASLVLAAGLGVSAVYAAQFAPVVLLGESKQEFLRKKVSLYDGVSWLNQHLGPDDTVAVDFWSLLYLDVPYVTFGTMGDLLPENAGAASTRAFVEQNGVTHLAVLDRDEARRRQAESIGARLIARVWVRPVRSRTRSSFGPRQLMLVYAVGRST
jgi:hypothetical protein